MKTINRTIETAKVTYEILKYQDGKLVNIGAKTIEIAEPPTIDKLQKFIQKEEGKDRLISINDIKYNTDVYSMDLETFIQCAIKRSDLESISEQE